VRVVLGGIADGRQIYNRIGLNYFVTEYFQFRFIMEITPVKREIWFCEMVTNFGGIEIPADDTNLIVN
jgi:hypothetical protein